MALLFKILFSLLATTVITFIAANANNKNKIINYCCWALTVEVLALILATIWS